MSDEEERNGRLVEPIRLNAFVKERRHFPKIGAILPSEKVKALHFPMPDLFVLLAPDAPPLLRRIDTQNGLVPFVLVGIEPPHERTTIPSDVAAELVVARHEKLCYLSSIVPFVFWKHLAPYGGMRLHLNDLPKVRKVAAMHDGIDVPRLEMPQCGP